MNRDVLQKEYRRAWFDVWGYLTAISQVVAEDFPDPDDDDARPIQRYDLDMVRGLAGALSALVERYERQE